MAYSPDKVSTSETGLRAKERLLTMEDMKKKRIKRNNKGD
jgi:hypothetical protein